MLIEVSRKIMDTPSRESQLSSNSSRRNFLTTAGTAAIASYAGLSLAAQVPAADESPQPAPEPSTKEGAEKSQVNRKLHYQQGKAEHCIFIWLGGGACHVDTWDPKQLGDPQTKKAGSAYRAIDTAIADVQVCEHLQMIAPMLDRGVIIRSLNHDVIDEHAVATNRVHVGRPPTGTTIYPSIGSVVSHELGPATEGVPAYVVMGYPNATRGPGFLGAKHSYIYLTDTEAGPAGLKRPDDIGLERWQRREQLLAGLTEEYTQRHRQDRRIAEYADISREALRLSGPEFMNVFDLNKESDSLRNDYGSEFGQRCLLSRRLIQSGVRFIEVAYNLNFINGTGWDTHNEGQQKQHLLIQDLDRVLATLVADLEAQRLLDKTLVVVATEFGRPPEFDGRGGRGHQCKAFSVAMFGGGLKTGQVIGATNEIGNDLVGEGVSVADFHATIYSALQINPAKELYDADRPVPITDRGLAVSELFG
jgi:hypothetical protein